LLRGLVVDSVSSVTSSALSASWKNGRASTLELPPDPDGEDPFAFWRVVDGTLVRGLGEF